MAAPDERLIRRRRAVLSAVAARLLQEQDPVLRMLAVVLRAVALHVEEPEETQPSERSSTSAKRRRTT